MEMLVEERRPVCLLGCDGSGSRSEQRSHPRGCRETQGNVSVPTGSGCGASLQGFIRVSGHSGGSVVADFAHESQMDALFRLDDLILSVVHPVPLRFDGTGRFPAARKKKK